MESSTSKEISGHPAKKNGFYYGYIIVIVSFIVMMMGWGLFYIYGVFFNPLTDEFGWSRAVTSAACSFCILISGIIGIAAGRLSDRFGPKKVLIVCTVVLALGYGLMSLVHSLWQFYVLYGLIIAGGLSGTWAPPLATVARWFVARRGLMTAIVTGGISIGTLVIAPIVTHLIILYGWRISYIIIGGAILIIMTISALFLRPSPDGMGLKAYGESSYQPAQHSSEKGLSLGQAMHTRTFWIFCTIYICFGFAQFSILIHIIPEAIGSGISPLQAAGILSIIGITGMAGRLVLGSVAETLRVKRAIIICLALMVICLLWLQIANSLWMLYLFAVVFGFSYGGVSCFQSLSAAEFFGLTSIGAITSLFSLSVNIGGAIGPVLTGYLYDTGGTYRWAFLICAAAVLLALVFGVSLKSPRK